MRESAGENRCSAGALRPHHGGRSALALMYAWSFWNIKMAYVPIIIKRTAPDQINVAPARGGLDQ